MPIGTKFQQYTTDGATTGLVIQPTMPSIVGVQLVTAGPVVVGEQEVLTINKGIQVSSQSMTYFLMSPSDKLNAFAQSVQILNVVVMPLNFILDILGALAGLAPKGMLPAGPLPLSKLQKR